AVSEPARVVLADDLPDARELTRLTLERTGRFRVVGEAGDGAEAIEMVTRHRPDLLLLDLAMPRVDGLRALPAIRSASPETKVVVLSGFDRSRLAHRAMAGGAVAYLEKTVSTRLLVDELLAVSGLLDAVGEALAEARDVDETATSGRGLALVRDLSERWGAEARADGKVIWFEVARPEAESHSGG